MKFCKIGAGIAALAAALLFSGCEKIEFLSEDAIREDVLAQAAEWPEEAAVDSFTVTKRTTDEEEYTDRVYVQLQGSTDTAFYQQHYYLKYEYDEEDGEWELSSIRADEEDLWKTEPLADPAEDAIRNALVGLYVRGDDCYGEITEETLVSFRVTEADTDREEGTSHVQCEAVLHTEMLEITCGAEASFVFSEEDGWQLTDSTAGEVLQYDLLPEVAVDMTPERCMRNLVGNRLYVGGYYTQNILLYEDVMRDFKLDAPVITDNGYYITYTGTFVWEKDLIALDVAFEFKIEYSRSDKAWYIDEITFDETVKTVEIPKTWRGTYNSGSMAAELTVTAVKADGTMDFLFSFWPMPGNESDASGSFKMNGFIDRETLEVDLDAGEWVEKPGYLYYTFDINGVFRADTCSIEGRSYQLNLRAVHEDVKEPDTHVADYLSYFSEAEIADLNAAIDQIRDAHGFDAVLMLNSTRLGADDIIPHYYNYHAVGVGDTKNGIMLNVNVGDYDYGWQYYWQSFGDKSNIFKGFDVSEEFAGFLDGADYYGAFRQMLLEVNRYLGGKDDDLPTLFRVDLSDVDIFDEHTYAGAA